MATHTFSEQTHGSLIQGSTHFDTHTAVWLAPVGRILFSLIFIMSVVTHFSQATIAYAASEGVPFAQVLVPLWGIVACAGGLSVLLGYHAKVGAWLIILFLVPVTLTMHRFWSLNDPAMAQVQQANFMKNVSLVGAALLISYFGAGAISLDARRFSAR